VNTITSNDGTKIAFDKAGSGPTVVIVDGALTTRSSGSKPQLVGFLSHHLTVYTYDRRGRGDSGDTPPYAIDREIEDIEALIEDSGGSAFLYGHSSGAALAFEAASKLGRKVKALAMYEAPYNDDPEAQRAWKEYRGRLSALLDAGRNGDAVALFMKLVGMPEEQISGMQHAPIWPMFEALAPSLAHDHLGVMGEAVRATVVVFKRGIVIRPLGSLRALEYSSIPPHWFFVPSGLVSLRRRSPFPCFSRRTNVGVFRSPSKRGLFLPLDRPALKISDECLVARIGISPIRIPAV
jgi:pimeloyl-ACP methyl ester carboxylesterase